MTRASVLGVGSPIVDLLAQVDDAFLSTVPGRKGGMELVDPATMDGILARLPKAPARAPGGSAGNTVCAMARAGAACAMLGKTGSDEAAAYYKEAFAAIGGDVSRFKTDATAPTARCLSLVTPDSERTMRTDLGAALKMGAGDVVPADFSGIELVHIEGYLLFNPDLLNAVLAGAAKVHATVSLDLGSFEVVNATKPLLTTVLRNSVDIVFANEDEAAAFTGDRDPHAALGALSQLCDIAAVKLGAKGALVARGTERAEVPVVPAPRVIDTTGAGDFWAAGFLVGWLQKRDIAACGRLGSLFGSEVVRHLGAGLDSAGWDRVRAACSAP